MFTLNLTQEELATIQGALMVDVEQHASYIVQKEKVRNAQNDDDFIREHMLRNKLQILKKIRGVKSSE